MFKQLQQTKEPILTAMVSIDTNENKVEAVSAPTGSVSSISRHASHKQHYTASSDCFSHDEKKLQKQVKEVIPNSSWLKPSSISSSSFDDTSASLHYADRILRN